MTKVMRKEARHTQRRDRASGVPLEILEHLPPKPASAYFLLCALTYTSDFMGGCAITWGALKLSVGMPSHSGLSGLKGELWAAFSLALLYHLLD